MESGRHLIFFELSVRVKLISYDSDNTEYVSHSKSRQTVIIFDDTLFHRLNTTTLLPKLRTLNYEANRASALKCNLLRQ